MNKTPIKAAERLSQYCFDHYNPDGPCKCPFWDRYPYGHCNVSGKPFAWPTSRIKEMNK